MKASTHVGWLRHEADYATICYRQQM